MSSNGTKIFLGTIQVEAGVATSYEKPVQKPSYPVGIKDLIELDIVSSNKNIGDVNISTLPYNMIVDGTYKQNIPLAIPIRSIGNVKDRIFKDSDGRWKIERIVSEIVLNGVENWESFDNRYRLSLPGIKSAVYETVMLDVRCTHFLKKSLNDTQLKMEGIAVGLDEYIYIYCKLETLTFFKEWLAEQDSEGTPMTIQYQLATPTYEVLSQELQTKLDNIPTFPEHNYVYTVTNDNLQPTLHVDYKKLSWLKSRLLFNTLKIYSRNLTDDEMIQNYKSEKDRFGM